MKHSHNRFIALAVAFVAAVVLALPVTALASANDRPPSLAPQAAWYNGKSHHFRSIVKDANGTVLEEGKDFDRSFCYVSDRSNTNADSIWVPTDDDMKDSGYVHERITFKGAYAKWGVYNVRHSILTLYDFFAPNVTKVEGEEDPTLQGTLQLTIGNPKTQFSASDFKLSREAGEEPGDYNIIVDTDKEQIPEKGKSNSTGTRTGLGTVDLGGYTTIYLAGDDICGFNYIRLVPGKLTITPAYTQVNVTVAWKDSSNKDGIRPSAEDFAKYLTLTADGEPTDAQAVVIENDNDTYNVVFDNVRKYAYNKEGVRHEIAYQVTQANIDGYTTDNATVGNEGTITNTHEIAAAPAEKPSTEKPAAKKTSRKAVPQTGDQSANVLAVVALGATALGVAVIMKKRNEL